MCIIFYPAKREINDTPETTSSMTLSYIDNLFWFDNDGDRIKARPTTCILSLCKASWLYICITLFSICEQGIPNYPAYDVFVYLPLIHKLIGTPLSKLLSLVKHRLMALPMILSNTQSWVSVSELTSEISDTHADQCCQTKCDIVSFQLLFDIGI